MKLTGISPVLLVADLERSVEYYRDRLGFECEVYGDPPDFAAARRDDATLLLALCADPERIVPNWKIVDNIWNAYIRVDDADAVYEEVQRRGAESTTRSTTRRMVPRVRRPRPGRPRHRLRPAALTDRLIVSP